MGGENGEEVRYSELRNDHGEPRTDSPGFYI
jgi:hypothetical protein